MRHRWFLVSVVLVLGACSRSEGEASAEAAPADPNAKYVLSEADTAGLSRAIFAGGCFWCMEPPFEKTEGVKAVISGYVGGDEVNPTYKEVSAGATGHTEAVLVTFDPDLIAYERLLGLFWVNHDPTTADRQFCDSGRQYRPGIFYLDEAQRGAAEASVAWARANKQVPERIVTEITKAGSFWPAENYHQDFYEKEPEHYERYRLGCRRDARLEELWGPSASR